MPDSAAQDFADRLSTLRFALGLSQATIGKAVGVSAVTICHWESGRYVPQAKRLRDLAAVLETSPQFLLVGTDDPFRQATQLITEAERLLKSVVCTQAQTLPADTSIQVDEALLAVRALKSSAMQAEAALERLRQAFVQTAG